MSVRVKQKTVLKQRSINKNMKMKCTPPLVDNRAADVDDSDNRSVMSDSTACPHCSKYHTFS